jgi:hypothetical protein
MLVKKSIVEAWYQRDSWVYKNFAYLFDNPLWSKRIPNGFSVCPYFWMSLFSLFIFCPLIVFPVNWFFRPIVKALGVPGKVVDRFLVRSHKCLLNQSDPDRVPTGVGGALLLLDLGTLFLMALVGFYSYAWVVNTYASFDGLMLGKFAFWSVGSFMGLFVLIGLHRMTSKSECKTLNYLWVWLLLFVIAAFVFIPSEIVTGTVWFFTMIWDFIASISIKVAGYVWWILAVTGSWLWFAAKWLFSWKPFAALLIPWWGFILLFSMAGWLADRLFKIVEADNLINLHDYSKEKFLQKSRRTWLSLFVKTLRMDSEYDQNTHLKYNNHLLESFKGPNVNYLFKAAYSLKDLIYTAAFEIMWKDELDSLQNKYPATHEVKWRRIEDDALDDAFRAFNALVEQLKIPRLVFNSEQFAEAIGKAYRVPEILHRVRELALALKDRDELNEERDIARQHSWAHVTCLKVTQAIGTVVSGIAKSSFRGIRKVCVQFATLCAYLWMFVKAKKKGACPYFTFTGEERAAEMSDEMEEII